MLIEFTIQNILSFKEKVTLSLLASGLTGLENNYINIDNKKILKTIALYGANASGKTNLFKAISIIKEMLIQSNNMDINDLLPITSFEFENLEKQPSFFEIKFIKNNIRYVYGFLLNAKEILEEYLYYYPNGKESIIFDRKNDNYSFNQSEEKILKEIVNKTAKNKFFLATATNWNFEKTKPAYDFLTRDINVSFNLFDLQNKSFEKYKNDPDNELKNFTLNFLKKADFNICDYEINDIVLPNKFMDSEIKKILDIIKTYNVVLTHKFNDKEYKMKFKSESLGTQILFILLPYLYETLNNCSVLFIDELDKSLHPFLIRYIVEIFNDSTINKNGSQLIFNTHDTNLLDLELFRRDQIWFTEKNNNTGISDLYSLNDFTSVRKTENIERGYLVGRYGAIPFVTNDLTLWHQEK